jgi:hypothetical protein
MRPLGEELLIVSLSPYEGRNTRAHPGIRAALCAAPVLDSWVAGTALPPQKELRKYVRKYNHETLEPALAALVTAGRVKTTGRMPKHDWLTDPDSAAAIRDRLTASLWGHPTALTRHDAALAVLLDSGRLWSWAFDPPAPRRVTITLTRGKPSAMRLRAAMLGSGTVVPAGVTATDLPSVARILYREIRDYGD